MAKKTSSGTASKPAVNTVVKAVPAEKITPAPIAAKPLVAAAATPPVAKAASAPVVTHEQIARRAYEISQSRTGGSEFENWVRAERELRNR